MKISTLFNITFALFLLLLAFGVAARRLPPVDLLILVAFFLATLSTQWFVPLVCAKFAYFLIKKNKNREAELVGKFGVFISKPWDGQFFRGTNLPRHMTPSMSCNNFVRLALHNQGKFAEQQVLDREFLTTIENESGTAEGRGVAKAKLAASIHKSGDLVKALELANEAINLFSMARLEERPNEVGNEKFMQGREKALGGEKAHAYFIRASILESIHRYDAALLDREKALKIAQDAFGEESKEATPHMTMLGKVLMKQKQYERSEEYLLKSLELRLKLLEPDDKLISSSRLSLSALYRECGQLEKSDSMLGPAMKSAEKTYSGSPGPAMAEYYQTAAFLRQKQGQKKEAEMYFKKARETFLKYFPKGHPIFYELNLRMIEFLTDNGKKHDTVELEEENAGIREKMEAAQGAVKL